MLLYKKDAENKDSALRSPYDPLGRRKAGLGKPFLVPTEQREANNPSLPPSRLRPGCEGRPAQASGAPSVCKAPRAVRNVTAPG